MSQAFKTIRLAHSPDPDDAFMFYPLAKGLLDSSPYEFEHVLRDIQTLNEWAREGKMEVTAISIHAYPYVRDKYRLLTSGCSMGDGYGPLIVAREAMTLDDLRGKTIAVPGEMTTAFLTLNLCLGKGAFDHRVVMFDEIPKAVADDQVDAGLIIHEGQLTYSQLELASVVDLGVWWQHETGLPLPLGGNVIRRDLGEQACREVSEILRKSIQMALENREAAVEYALQFGRDLDVKLADKFIGMYVNAWTLDYGEKGRQAVAELLRRGHEAGICPDPGEVDFV